MQQVDWKKTESKNRAEEKGILLWGKKQIQGIRWLDKDWKLKYKPNESNNKEQVAKHKGGLGADWRLEQGRAIKDNAGQVWKEKLNRH